MSFSQKLLAEMERERQELGVSIADLCLESGIDPSTWWRWQKGEASPLVCTLDRVQVALNLRRELKLVRAQGGDKVTVKVP